MADRQTIERLKDQALEMRELILKLSAKTLILFPGGAADGVAALTSWVSGRRAGLPTPRD